MDIMKLSKQGFYESEKFKGIAEAVANGFTSVGEGVEKEDFKQLLATSMAMGAISKRTGHILTGMGIGVLGTSLAFVVGNKIKKRGTVTTEDLIKETNDKLDKDYKNFKKQNEKFKEDMSIIDKVNEILKNDGDLDDLKEIIDEINNEE